MIIRKDSELVKIFKVLLEDHKTPGCSTVVSKVEFYKNKGISFRFLDSNKMNLKYKEETVDFECSIEDSWIVTLILSILKDKEEVELKVSNGKLVVDNLYEFNASNDTQDYDGWEWHYDDIVLNTEQIEELRKDCFYTVGNYFSNPKSTNVVGIANNSGSIYKLIPSVYVYKIEPLNGLINDVKFSQSFGHSDIIWILPKVIFDIISGSNKAGFYFINSNYVSIATDKIDIHYNTDKFGTTKFKDRLKWFGSTPRTDLSPDFNLSKIKKVLLDDYSTFELEEDKNISIVVENNIATIKIGGCTYSTNIEENNFVIKTNFAALLFVLKNCSDNAVIREIEEDNAYLVIDGDSTIYIPRVDFLD